jgi:hypothetical protein
MSNAEDRAFELLAIAEKQQLEIQAELAAIQHNNERLKTQLSEAVKQAAELTAKKIESRAALAVKEFNHIKWTHYAYVTGGMFLFVLFITMFSILWIPSFDEVAERREMVEKYGVDIKRVDGKNLVHIMSKQCYSLNGSTVRDWCVMDPK